jgi:hypothetical protein
MIRRYTGTRVGAATLSVVVLAMLVVLFSAVRAGAALPWWHVNTVSAPASVPGGEGQLMLEVSDLGDAPVDGAAHPVTIVDQLPAGVRPTHVYGEGGGSFPVGIHGVKEIIHCEIVGQMVTCTYAGPLLDYERFMIAITVEVEPGTGDGVGEAVVSGGGAPRAVWRHALALGEVSGFAAETYELTPEEEGGDLGTQAGSHPFQLTSTLIFNTRAVPVLNSGTKQVLPEVQPVALAKDLRFELPPGLVGNPIPLPKCPVAVFLGQSKSKCPDDTAVGVASPIITNPFSDAFVPFALTVPLYSLEPAVGEPARFGFTTQAGPVVLDTSVPPDGGAYPVVVSAPDIPDDFGFIGAQVTLWGVPGLAVHDTARGSCLDQFEGGDVHHIVKFETSCPVQGKPQPFVIMPTSCTGPLKTTVEGDPWEAVGHFVTLKEYTFSNSAGETIGLDGCDRLSFDPSMNVAPDSLQASTPSSLTVDVHVDQEASLDPNGLAEATVKDTTVALPVGVTLNPAAADGLAACTLGEIGLESAGEQSCPEASKIGLVEIDTPLLPNPLKGAAYLAAQEANPFGSLLAIYVVVYDPVSGVRVKLAGEVKPDPETGQLVSTFKDTPQLPFEDFVVRFFGGSRAPLGTPALCGEYRTSASIAPWSGAPAAQVLSPPFQITSGANGAPCESPLPFAPSVRTGSLNLQAGAFTPFTMTMSREDGDQSLRSVQLRMPPGLSGLLTGVALCPEGQANAGQCAPQSLIGETTVSVGLGSNPYAVKGGKVYLTGPYEGAPFGLSIVNPAKAGPFDLENTKLHHPACDCLVVRARIEVDPVTAALTVTSDSSGPYSIPQSLEGIPLQIKHVNVTIDRPGFTFNPTDCQPMKIAGSLSSGEGAMSALSVPFQVTNCATLRFKPQFSVSTPAHTSRARGAGLHVKLAYPKSRFGSQANIRSVKVSLPKQLPSRLTTLQKACLAGVFEQNPAMCPAASRVGIARATTPLLPVELNGPAYFVSHGGARFPELVVVLSGYGVTVDLHGETSISEKTSITSSTFRTIPDVPVGTFELSLPQGPNSALAAFGNLCSSKLKMPTAFTAQNGMTIHQSTPISVTGCHKTKPKPKRSKHGKKARRGK